MDKSAYEVSDLEDFQFHLEDPDLNMDAVFRPVIDTPLPLQLITFLRWVQWLKPNSDRRRGRLRELCSPFNNSSLWETNPAPCVDGTGPFETKLELVSDYFNRNSFEEFILFLLCTYFQRNYNHRFSFYHNLFQKLVGHMWDKSSYNIAIIIFGSSSKLLHISSPNGEKEKKVGRHSKIKIQDCCETEYKK